VESIFTHFIFSIFLGFFLQLILHEIGHLIFGLLTGWDFLIFQLNRFALLHLKNKNRLAVVRSKNYQCIMSPKSINSNPMLYTIGGCIVNLFSAVTGFLIILINRMTPSLWLYIWSFTVFGIGFYVMNGTFRINRICNDKACYDLLKYNPYTRLCHNAQLIIAKYLANGFTYRQIGKELICICPDTAGNDIEAYQDILEYYYYLDMNQFNMAEQALNKIDTTASFSREITDTLQMEQIYIKLLQRLISNDKNEIDFPYFDVRKHTKKGDVHALRVITVTKAYAKFKEGDLNSVWEIIDKAISEIERSFCVYEGEKLFCIGQLKNLKSIIEDKID